jgi:predicted transposase/invertase (TIGR01784 family)
MTMAAFRINRTNDAVFKAIFAKYPKITLALINAFLEFQGTEQLVDIEFIDREIDSDEYDGKESRLDILGVTASGVKVNIEMQVNSLAAMGERSLFYWARNYADLKRGEEYDQLKRTIAINILGFNLFDEKKYPDMHSCFGIYDIKTQCQLTDKLEIHFLELPKFKSKSVKDMNRMEKWAAYFSPGTTDEELEEIAAAEEAIREAMEVEDVFTKDEVAKRSYEKAEKFRRDQAAQLNYAEKRGEEKGIRGTVVALKSLNLDKKAIAIKLAEAFGLDDKAADKYVEANW